MQMQIVNYIMTGMFVLMFSVGATAQKTRGEFLKINFSGMIDSLIKPPSNCEEAWKLVDYDTLTNEVVPIAEVIAQNEKITKIGMQIDSLLKKNSIGRRHLPPRGDDIPQNSPPSGNNHPNDENLPDNLGELFRDINEMNLSMDKLIVAREKLKSDISSIQKTASNEIRNTRVGEFDKRNEIINNFLDTVGMLYNNFESVVKENMPDIDEIIKKYDYGAKISATPMANDILKTQSSELEIIKFLFNVSKELINLGAKFYKEQRDRQR